MFNAATAITAAAVSSGKTSNNQRTYLFVEASRRRDTCLLLLLRIRGKISP